MLSCGLRSNARLLRLGVIASALMLTASLTISSASADDLAFTFTKIADTDTPIPSGSGTFEGFDEPVIDGINIAFVSITDELPDALFFYDGNTLIRVLAACEPAPGAPGLVFEDNPTLDDEISIEGSTIGFEAELTDGVDTFEAIYTYSGGTFTLHALAGTTINPSTGVPFGFVDEPGLSGGKIAFRSPEADDEAGVITNVTGPLTTVMDSSTPVPGFPTYSFTANCCDLSFDGNIGIEYDITDGVNEKKMILLVTPAGALTPIANTINTLSPSTGVLFDAVQTPEVQGTTWVFRGRDANGFRGVYTNLNGVMRIVADENTTAPGSATTFTDFDEDAITLSGDRILFEGSTANGKGAYIEHAGTLCKVLAAGDTLDGKLVSGVDLALHDAISGDRVVMDVSFDDGSAGIYMAELFEDCNDNGVPDHIDRQECPDIDCDGVVTFLDLWQVIFNFGQTGPNEADVNNDGIVNFWDYLIVAFSQWQFCGW